VIASRHPHADGKSRSRPRDPGGIPALRNLVARRRRQILSIIRSNSARDADARSRAQELVTSDRSRATRRSAAPTITPSRPGPNRARAGAPKRACRRRAYRAARALTARREGVPMRPVTISFVGASSSLSLPCGAPGHPRTRPSRKSVSASAGARPEAGSGHRARVERFSRPASPRSVDRSAMRPRDADRAGAKWTPPHCGTRDRHPGFDFGTARWTAGSGRFRSGLLLSRTSRDGSSRAATDAHVHRAAREAISRPARRPA